MANPPKVKDPAEAALSAVEEALKLDFGGPNDTEEPSTGSAADATPAHSTDAETPVPTEGAEVSTARRRRTGRGARPAAANDDRRSIGNLIYALQRRPSNAPFWLALVLSVIWGGIGGMLAYSAFGPELAAVRSFEDVARSPSLVLAVVGVAVPIVFFWVMAMMI